MKVRCTSRAGSRRRPAGARRRGFTLIELGIVILIIGLIAGFILAASLAATEQGRARATQALITKLELGVNERLNALMATSPPINGAHRWLASINPPGNLPGQLPLFWGLQSNQRAAVIARVDAMRMELPDVFLLQTTDPEYPVNFAGVAYGGVSTGDARDPYLLPLGHMADAYRPNVYADPPANTLPLFPGPGDYDGTSSAVTWRQASIGIYGASHNARAALHKLIGYSPTGTDALDNDNDGLIDELDEGVPLIGRNGIDDNGNGLIDERAEGGISEFLNNHTHETARAETLYAILIGGSGPLGSVFSAEEFDETEVRDTDNDGLPEFVDGWGKPLQFFRWPVYYPSSVQKGSAIFTRPWETRPNFPLDPNGELVAPAWWGLNDATSNPSAKAILFQSHFTSLADPNFPSAAAPNPPTTWDRSRFYPRRAFGCRFLILSSGPDGIPGVTLIDPILFTGDPANDAPLLVGSATADGENWAQFSNRYPRPAFAPPPPPPPDVAPPYLPPEAAEDDITNHDINTTSGVIR